MGAMDFEERYRGGDYLAETGDWHEDDAAWKAAHVHGAIARAGLTPKTIIDVGCGSGGVIARLQPCLPDAALTGYEIAGPAYALAALRANDRLRFVNASVLDDPDASADLALALDVFEHVPDYLGFLEGLRDVAPRIIFHIPLDLSIRGLIRDVPMQRRQSVGHLHYFTTATARAMLEECGYRIVEARHTHAIMQPPPKGWKLRLRRAPHRWLFALNPTYCATVLGGCSLLVVAESR